MRDKWSTLTKEKRDELLKEISKLRQTNESKAMKIGHLKTEKIKSMYEHQIRVKELEKVNVEIYQVAYYEADKMIAA